MSVHPPIELSEPPLSPDGVLVPGSPFPDADWAMAAHRLAAGWPVIQVARALGCHRSTVWRAYHGAPAFRARVAWERACQQREALARLRALGALAVSRIEMALAQGDLTTARWVVERLCAGRFPEDEALTPPPGPDLPDHAVGRPEERPVLPPEPEQPPLDWMDEFAPDLPLPRPAARRG